VPHPSRILAKGGIPQISTHPVSVYPPFAKYAKDPGFLPRSTRQDRVCGFH
jgi:hypothetical protein